MALQAGRGAGAVCRASRRKRLLLWAAFGVGDWVGPVTSTEKTWPPLTVCIPLSLSLR